ncbi:MAG: hypothetical protein ACP5NL_05700 [Thermoplasmata archaeon]
MLSIFYIEGKRMDMQENLDASTLERLSLKARRARTMIIGSTSIFLLIILITLLGTYEKVRSGSVYHTYIQQYPTYFVILWIFGIVIYFTFINIGIVQQRHVVEEYSGKKYREISPLEIRQILLKLKNYRKNI